MKNKFKFTLFIFMCLAIFRPSRADSFQRTDLVDPNVDIVLRISNAGDFMKALTNSSYGKLWNSPEMKPFLNNQSLGDTLIKSILLSRVNQSVIAEVLHLNQKILSLLKGELIFGIELGKKSKNGSDEKKKGKFYALAEMNETDYKEIIDLSRQESKVLGEKTVSQRYTFQGVEVIQDITSGEEDELTEWTAFCGNTYINGSSRQWVEQCIVLLKKELPVKPSGSPFIQAWVPDGFFQRLLKAEEDKRKTIGKEPSWDNVSDSTILIKALGIDKVGKFSLEWVINPSYSELNIYIQNKGGNKGMWTLLSRENLPRNLLTGYIPDDVLSYQVIRINVPAFWQEIPSILETFGPQAAAQFQAWLNMAGQLLQVDIGRDIVANLDTLLTYYSRLEDAENVYLYIMQLRNPILLEKTLGKLFVENSWLRNVMKDKCEVLELKNYKIYSIKMPKFSPSTSAGTGEDSQTGGQPSTQPKVDWVSYGAAVVNGDLVFGRLNLLRSYITGSKDDSVSRKFYKSPIFMRLIQRVPDNAIGCGFSDVTQWIETVINYLKTSGRSSQLSPKSQQPVSPGEEKSGGVAEPDPKPSPFDDFYNNLAYDRLPSSEFVRSFFGPWINYYQFDGEDLVIKWEFHNPPGK